VLPNALAVANCAAIAAGAATALNKLTVWLNHATSRKTNATRIKPKTWCKVESLTLKDWSPEQISGYLKSQGQPSVSHERIYQHIYDDNDAESLPVYIRR
jgi:IS30 family transposase